MSIRLEEEEGGRGILCLNFNQNQECFACGTTSGFCIFNVDPFTETFRREFKGGSIGYVAMLYRCNILALVGGGRSPCFLTNKVVLWDDHLSTCTGELSFRSEVKTVKLRRDLIVVALENSVYVYQFQTLDLLEKFSTRENPKGLVALSTGEENVVLACPASDGRGRVRVEIFSPEDHNQRISTFVDAHESGLSQLTLSADGSLLATASTKGTLIRIFDTGTGRKIKEVRRGADNAVIYCICFSPDNRFLACTSDKGTVHIFAVNAPELSVEGGSESGGVSSEGSSSSSSQKIPENRKSRMSMFGSFTSYFKSEWSFAKFKGPEIPTIAAFGKSSDTLYLLSADRMYRKLTFDPVNGGTAEEVLSERFLSEEE